MHSMPIKLLSEGHNTGTFLDISSGNKIVAHVHSIFLAVLWKACSGLTREIYCRLCREFNMMKSVTYISSGTMVITIFGTRRAIHKSCGISCDPGIYTGMHRL